MKYSHVIKKLKSLKNKKNVKGMARFGITGKQVLGISIYKLREIGKEIGTNHKLALKLYKSPIREAKILASYIVNPVLLSSEELNNWVERLESWDEVDQCCDVFSLSRFSFEKMREWTGRREEFVKRAGFVIMCYFAVHNKDLPDCAFNEMFDLIIKHSKDERNYVRKAVNWALRSIGKRNKSLNKKAVKVSERLIRLKDKNANWIGKNALKELTSEKVQKRLDKKKI